MRMPDVTVIEDLSSSTRTTIDVPVYRYASGTQDVDYG